MMSRVLAAQDFRRPGRARGAALARHRRQDHSPATIGQDQECGGVNGRTRLVAMAVAIAMTCLPASAQELRAFYTGNDLRSRCSDTSPYQAGLCMGFVTGIADAMGIAHSFGSHRGAGACRRKAVPRAASGGSAGRSCQPRRPSLVRSLPVQAVTSPAGAWSRCRSSTAASGRSVRGSDGRTDRGSGLGSAAGAHGRARRSPTSNTCRRSGLGGRFRKTVSKAAASYV